MPDNQLSPPNSFNDRLSLALLIALSFFLMADMYITPAIIPELAAEYQVGPDTLGWAGSAFVLLGTAIGLIFGYLNDRFSRKKLLIITVLVGEVPCLLTGIPAMTSEFEGFLLMRVLTGFGVGGIFPITFSLLSDYISNRHRAKASAGVDIAWGLGIMAGPLVASYAVTTDYGWRLAFIIASLPSFPLIAIYALVGDEPERGAKDGGLPKQSRLPGYNVIFKKRSNILLFLQGIPGSLPWGILPFWLITFFRESRQFSSEQATLLWEVFGIATIVGGVFWASIGDWLYKKRASYVTILCTVIIALAIIPELLLLNLQFASTTTYFLMGITGGLMISVGSANIRALLMNLNASEHRGRVFSIYNLSDNIGKGLGPAVGGVILAQTNSYQLMVNTAVSFWAIAAVLFFFLIFTIDKDVLS